AQVRHLPRPGVGTGQRGHGRGQGPGAAGLMLGRYGASLPWHGRIAGPAVVDQRQALALRVLEVEYLASVAFGDVAVRNTEFREAGQPVPQARFARDAKTGAGDAAAAATLA